MLLTDYIQIVYVPARIDLCLQYRKKLDSVTSKFSEWLRRAAVLADLTEQNIGGYLTFYRQSWSARSTNNQRQVLFSLWQDAADSSKYAPLLAEHPNPRRVRKLAEERDPPQAWRKREIRQLIAYCKELPGLVGDVPASLWWLSLFLTIHWTSSRIGAMLAVKAADYDGRGLLIRKQKNHKPQWFPLPKSCRRIIEQIRPNDRALIWATPWCMRHVWTKARKIIEDAGLPCPKTGRNLFHRVRRTTITYCAKADPAIAQRTAGHRDYATTLRSYVDPRIVRLPSAVDVLFDPMRPHHSRPTPTKAPQRLRIVG